MAKDYRLAARRAIIGALTGKVTASLYGEGLPAAPVWPFVLVESATVTPYDPSCIDGSIMELSIHSFARGASADAALSLSDQITGILGDQAILTDDGLECFVTWTGGPPAIKDTDGYHVTSDYTIEISAVTV